MCREIKFRVWNDEEMISPDYIALGGNAYWKENSIPSYATPDKIMQFTGLKDKNGVDIYEGDIVEFDAEEWGSLDNKFLVEWDANAAAWYFGGGSTSEMHFRSVIGNIHENPDLLK